MRSNKTTGHQAGRRTSFLIIGEYEPFGTEQVYTHWATWGLYVGSHLFIRVNSQREFGMSASCPLEQNDVDLGWYEHNSAAGKTTGADCLPLLLTGVQEEGQDTGSGKMWLKMKTHYKV